MTAASRPVHAPITQFETIDGCLAIGGISVKRLAARVGSTPFYAYDRNIIAARVRALRATLPADVHIHYAMKANPMPAVVHLLAGLVDGLDVASAAEMQIALDTGIDAGLVSFAGPGKTDAEIERAVAAGVVLNVESRREIESAASCGARHGLRPRIAVRLNPDFELKSSGMKMGGGPKQFGIDVEQLPGVFEQIKQRDVEFCGLHIFSGSQNLRAEAIVEAQTKSVELALRVAEQAPSPIRILNIGGGFGIPYFPGEQPLAVTLIADNLRALTERTAASLPGAQLVIELGRYLVGEAGVYVCRVIDRKISRGQVFLVTDGGLHHHLAASGNFGQVVRKNYPVRIATRMNCEATEEVSVVGPLCTPLDLLADRMQMPRADVGDLIAVFQSGAYGRTASPTAFLSHPLPAEVLV